jgi:hypothetical protein
MAATAFQVQYRDEFIAGFEQRTSLLRSTVTTEAVISGNQAVFLVADSGGAEAKTRGANGMIPARSDNLLQPTATLVEWHDLVQKTRFNIFAGQGDQRRIMQETSMAVINRKIDQDILAALSAATQTTGAATTMSVAKVAQAITILGNNNVEIDGRIYGAMSPGMFGYLLQTTEFASADFVDNKPFTASARPTAFRWAMVNWVVHPGLAGAGTAAEVAYVYHQNAIGHAVDTSGMQSPVGYNEEQDYSWARCSVFMGSKLLQNAGVVKLNHDAAAISATS